MEDAEKKKEKSSPEQCQDVAWLHRQTAGFKLCMDWY